MVAAFLWYLSASCIGWLTWPLTAYLFKYSPSRGYAYNRVLGLVLLAYPSWLLNSVGHLPHTAAFTRLFTLIVACAALGLAWILRRQLRAWFIECWRTICVIEMLYLTAFTIFCLFKSLNPAIQHTEQPMDLMILGSLIRSPQIPPLDPWLSGYSISYYYGGYYIISQLAQITLIPATIAYNLGLATTFATAGITVYGVIYDLVVPRTPSTIGISRGTAWSFAVVVALLGASNMAGVLLWCERLLQLAPTTLLHALGGPSAAGYEPWWWFASRAITDPNFIGRSPGLITEFPAFSFILGDLHPHLMALPFVLLALAFAVEIGHHTTQKPWWCSAICWLSPIVIGILGWINTWDLPTFGLVLALSCALFSQKRKRLILPWMAEMLSYGVYLIALSLLLFLPFYLSLTTQITGIGILYYSKTSLLPFFLTSGAALVPIGVFLVSRQPGQRRRWLFIAVWLGVTILPWFLTALISSPGRTLLGLGISLLRGPWVLLLLSLVITLAAIGIFRQKLGSQEDSHLVFVGLFTLVGCGLLYGVEFFYVRDMFQNRMNSLFKVSYQAWILLTIAALLAIRQLAQFGTRTRWLFWFFSITLAFGCAFTASMGMSNVIVNHGKPTLDGMAYLSDIAPGDYGAIRWLDSHADVGDILVEGVSSDYGNGNRLSAFSGVPTLLGWPGHEWQWRGSGSLVEQRQHTVETIFTSDDQVQVLSLLHENGVRYLYVGPNEVITYQLDDQHTAWFGSFLTLVYSHTTATLYQVP
jgi:YYY domain-containing protein